MERHASRCSYEKMPEECTVNSILHGEVMMDANKDDATRPGKYNLRFLSFGINI